MASIFEQTIVPKIDFSNFDLSETQILTCNFGQLIPCFVREVLPNDVFTLGASSIVNFAPMVAPMYQDVHTSMHFFFVPNRIVFDDFEQFITGAVEGEALPEDEIPVQPGLSIKEISDALAIMEDQSNVTSFQGTILDYFGLPDNLTAESQQSGAAAWYESTIISDILMRDYFKIWFDYYRDENLQTKFVDSEHEDVRYFDAWRQWRAVSDASDAIGSTNAKDLESYLRLNNFFKPRYRSFRKDYFTACLPSPQKGEPVSLSITGNAPVVFPDSVYLGAPKGYDPARNGFIAHFNGSVEDDEQITTTLNAISGSTSAAYLKADASGENLIGIETHLYNNISQASDVSAYADLSSATAVTVEQLREAFAVQEILESLSMRGSRYTEFLRGNFGVSPDDYKLQRPQFLGGLVTPVQVQQILQQSGYSGEDSRDMTGYAAGRAFAAVGGRIFRQRFKEHGYIIGIMSIMPKAYYYQGIPRHFMRKDRFDYYLPQTAHLGEQGVSKMELFYDKNQYTANDTVFGYIPRWAEYKTATNGIHGDFRGSLNYYHMAREFSSQSSPTLSESFISTQNVPTRPFAVWQTENPTINHLCWVQCYFKVIASRPMPYHSIPKVL